MMYVIMFICWSHVCYVCGALMEKQVWIRKIESKKLNMDDLGFIITKNENKEK